MNVDTAHAPEPAHAAGAAAPDYAACRAQFEKSLLPYLKSPDAAAQRTHAGALAAAIAPLAPAGSTWRALHAVALLVADGVLAGDLYVKQLFGQINLQLRRLAQGQAGLPESMLRDALFFIAAAPQVAEGEAALLRRAWRLDGAVPPDYTARRYGRVDPGALKQAKEALARSKSDWDQLAVRRRRHPRSRLQGCAGKPCRRQRKARRPGAGPAAARTRAGGERLDRDQTATTSSPSRWRPPCCSSNTAWTRCASCRTISASTPKRWGSACWPWPRAKRRRPQPDWQNELAHQIQQGQTVAVLAGEIKSGLRQVEKLLDEYYDEPQHKRGALVAAGPVLHQIQGALSILDQDAAARTAHHVRAAVAEMAEGDGDVQAQAGALHNIARNIGALGFFTDMLAQNSDSAKGRFIFDEEAGLLRELSFEQAGSAPAPGRR